MQKDKEQHGAAVSSLHGSCYSSEKLHVEEQELWWFFWSLLGDFQCFLPGSGHHSWNNPQPPCLQNPSWFFLCFPGSEEVRAWDELCSSWVLELNWAVVSYELSGERMVLVCALPPAAKHRIDWISRIWAHGIAFLTQRKENRNIAGNKTVQKIQKQPWQLRFTIPIRPDPS